MAKKVIEQYLDIKPSPSLKGTEKQSDTDYAD